MEKTCLDCKHYSMDSGEEIGRMSLDFCVKHQTSLPTAAFCYDDLCCHSGSFFNKAAFLYLQERGETCGDYEKT
jgi:hypothetical protein